MTPDPLIQAFQAEGRPRVWSLIVTILGDMALPRGGRFATSVFAGILDPLGISESALRTALSRLAQDGWVLASKEGRISHFRLTPQALRATQKASEVIYAPPTDSRWTLGIGPAPDGAIPLTEGWIAKDGAALPPGAMAVTGDLQSSGDVHPLVPETLQRMLAAMTHDLQAVDPAQALTHRLLLMHRWRRLCLKVPDVPPVIDPMPGTSLRAAMAQAYVQLWDTSEDALTHIGAPPLSEDAPLRRFASTHNLPCK